MRHRFHHRHRIPHFMRHAARPGHRLRGRLAWGGALVAAGTVALLRQHGVLDRQETWLLAPALLAWSALLRLVVKPTARTAAGAFARLALAAYLVVVIEHVGGWTFAATWPVLLIAYGVTHVAHALSCWQARAHDEAAAGEEPTW